RLAHAAGAALDRHPVRLLRVRNRQRDVSHTVAVPAREGGDLVVVGQRTRQHEAYVALAEDVRGPGAHAGLRARVPVPREAEGVLEVVRGLSCVPNPQLDVVPPVERHRVRRGHRLDLSRAAQYDRTMGGPPAEVSEAVAALGGDLDTVLGDVQVAAGVADRNGIIRWQNARAVELFGDRVGQPLASMVAPESTHDWRRQFSKKVLGTTKTTDYRKI